MRANGEVVVGQLEDFDGELEAAIWVQGQGSFRIKDVLRGQFGLGEVADWNLALPNSISADGLTICGLAVNKKFGNLTGWVCHLPELPYKCPGDTDDSWTVNVDDLVNVILGWGACGNCAACPGDATHDCTVDVDDLVAVILGWGECP